MSKRTAILSAILLGLASPSFAQERAVGRRADGARASRGDLVVHRPAAQIVRTVRVGSESGRDDIGGNRSRGTGRSDPILVPPRRGRGSKPGGEGARHGIDDHGRYRWVTRKVWVPATYRRVLVPARYERRWDPARRRFVTVCMAAEYYRTVFEPGHWEYQRVRVPVRRPRSDRRRSHRHGSHRRGLHIRF